MTYNETINSEDDKIKDYLGRESKNTCIIREKQSFFIQNRGLSRYLKTQS